MDGEMGCPHTERLKELLAGRLGEEAQNRLAGHLDTCETCRAALDEFAGQRRLVSALAGLTQSDRTARVPALQQAIARLKAIGAHQSTQADARDATLLGEEINEHLSLDFLEPSENPQHLGRLGEYEIVEVIGCGGMGVVLKAHDPTLDRFVAVKVLSPVLASNPRARKRFLREARAAAAVNHEHVVAVHAVGETAGLPLLVMEYIHGRSLQQRIDAEGPLAVEDVLRVGYQAAMGLAGAHAQGLIHRDVKPANILLEDEGGHVCITDFGLARAADDVQITRSGVVAGTPQFMSPEQARGKPVDPRSDLFSLGCVMYAMCTGRPPFGATGVLDAMRRVAEEDPPPIEELAPDTPNWLVEIVEKLLAKDAAERFQSAAELADFLGRHLAHLQQPDVIPPPPRLTDSARPSRRTRRGRRIVALLAALVVGLGLTEATGVTHVADYLAAVLRIRTPHGTLVVKIHDPEVKVLVDADSEEITLEGIGEHEITLRPGRHQWQAIRDGVAGQTEWVTIEQGGKKAVEVLLDRPEAPDDDAIDLLKLIDPQRDSVTTLWMMEGGALVSPAGLWPRLQIPCLPPEEYDLVFEADQQSPGTANLTLGLIVGGRQTLFTQRGSRGGLCTTDKGPEIETTPLSVGQHVKMRVAVRNSGVRVAWAGNVVLDWRGSPDCLGPPPTLHTLNKDCLAVGTNNTCYRITRMDLIPVTGQAQPLFRAKARERLSAEYVLWKGGQVSVSAEGGPLLSINRVAELPDSFHLVGVSLRERGWRSSKGPFGVKPMSFYFTAATRDEDLAFAPDLASLVELDLGLTRITDAGPAHVTRHWPGLRRLVLSDTAISDDGLSHLKDLKQLEGLDLSGTKISDAGLETLKDVTRLKRLLLDDTRISDAGLAHLSAMPCLEYVSLSGTGVSETGLRQLEQLDGLRCISLVDAKVHQRTAARLREPLPAFRSEHDTGPSVDLLRLIDVPRDSVHGVWRRGAGALVSPEDRYSRLQVPYLAPEEYDLEVEAERRSGSVCLCLGVTIGGRQAVVVVDDYPSRGGMTILEPIDGRWGPDNETAVETQVFPIGKKAKVTVAVRKSGVRVMGRRGHLHRLLIDWRGSPDRIVLNRHWCLPNRECLFVGTHESSFRITKLDLIPVRDEGNQVFPAEDTSSPERLAAKHVLWQGGRVWVSVDGGPPVPVGRVTDLPASFRLRCVDLRGYEEISDRELAPFARLGSVEHLDLAGTAILDQDLHRLSGVPGLTGLDLGLTSISDDALAYLEQDSPGLRRLILCGTAVSDQGARHLAALAQLEGLDLRGTRISDAGLQTLKRLTGLKRLMLDHTRVTDAGLLHLSALPRLEYLSLAGTEVSDTGLEHVRKLKSLKELCLIATAVSDSGVAGLKRAMPECRLDIDAGEAVDLLKLIDPSRDSVQSGWRSEAGALVSPAVDLGRLQIPYSPPEEYAVEMVAQRVSGSDSVVVGLAAAGRQVAVIVDGWPKPGPATALETLDGTDAFNNETALKTTVFTDKEPVRVLVTVRHSHITVACGTRVLIDWRGDFGRLSIDRKWAVPNRSLLFLGSCGSSFRITELKLIPISGTGEVVTEPRTTSPES